VRWVGAGAGAALLRVAELKAMVRVGVVEWSASQEGGSRVALFSKWPQPTAKEISLGGGIVALIVAGTRY